MWSEMRWITIWSIHKQWTSERWSWRRTSEGRERQTQKGTELESPKNTFAKSRTKMENRIQSIKPKNGTDAFVDSDRTRLPVISLWKVSVTPHPQQKPQASSFLWNLWGKHVRTKTTLRQIDKGRNSNENWVSDKVSSGVHFVKTAIKIGRVDGLRCHYHIQSLTASVIPKRCRSYQNRMKAASTKGLSLNTVFVDYNDLQIYAGTWNQFRQCMDL
jgi:hypothetical protein